MEYVKKINDLRETPEFYNTLTTNCTTSIITLIRAFGGDIHYSWKILLSGYTAEYVYELGRLDTTLPFAELRKQSYINKRAHEAGDDSDFSLKIRADSLCHPCSDRYFSWPHCIGIQPVCPVITPPQCGELNGCELPQGWPRSQVMVF